MYPGTLLTLLTAAILLAASTAQSSLVISEFMAANNTFLNDEDGQNSDWIEIHNTGTTTINLNGWALTDSTNNLRKWVFPSTNLSANAYLLVFASEKDRRTPGRQLHSNFKLGADGEFLALVAPDGAITSSFSPIYPPQVDDISYGLTRDLSSTAISQGGNNIRAYVPSNDELGDSWTLLGFNDSGWMQGNGAVGYDRQIIGVNFLPLIGINVETQMYNINQTIYIRLPFVIDDPTALAGLVLRMRFEDGFVAYLNGQEVARSNAPTSLTWNSAATAPRTDTAATNITEFDISAFRGSLLTGTNILAIHGLNIPVSSPDLLILPELVGTTASGSAQLKYFTSPTPAQPNNNGVSALGPIISNSSHAPAVPRDNEDIVVSARIRPSFGAIDNASLHYRIMFGSEVTVPLEDNGQNGDPVAGDGFYTGRIPASASAAGQMVRWYITAQDGATNNSRFPAFLTADSPAYFGTVVENPALTNALPVFHWFVQNVSATDTVSGTRASIFWNGHFYDNVFCRVRGASAPSFPKKPYKFDFNPGDHFHFIEGVPQVEEINLNTTYQDKSYVRTPLTYETYKNAGVPAADAFPVRIQQNNAFFSISIMTEQLDDDFLKRRGLDANGALYKIYNGLDSATSGVEKKTRRSENNSDLQQLVNAVSTSNPNRGTAIFDVLDLPEIVNYLAAGTIAQDWDRIVKNIYVYRDTEGTGQWQMLPWDKDLSFGKVGLVNDTVTAIRDGTDRPGGGEPYFSHPFYGTPERNCCGMNHLFDAIYKTPRTREMYLRRLRTLMDALLQPSTTPPHQRLFENRIDQMTATLAADAVLDLNKWGTTYGVRQDMPTAINALKTDYLIPRRTHLYVTHNQDNTGNYLAAAGIPHAQAGTPLLRFGQIEFNPTSGRQSEEYVEIENPNPIAVDISGWKVEGGIDLTFKAGTVIPAGGRMYISPDLVAFRGRTTGPRGNQGLFAVGNYSGQLSARGENLRLLNSQGTLLASTNYLGNLSPAQQFLRITKLMYNSGIGNAGEDNLEYIELKNISTNITLDLRGVSFSDGIEFNFTNATITTLLPGQRILLVRNPSAFTDHFGSGFPIAGQYTGALNNTGERLKLLDSFNEEILDFTYMSTWHRITDGPGFALVIVDENAAPDSWGNPSNWRPSSTLFGNPGSPDPLPPPFPAVLINEVLARTDNPPPLDSIELYNSTSNSIDVGGWFLTDNLNEPKKYRISPNTVIPPFGFLVLSEDDFNMGMGAFTFSSQGEEAWLLSGDAQTNLTGYAHGVQFGASENLTSFGRHIISTGAEHFVAQSSLTLGETNSGPKVGPIVISEIMYNPPLIGTNNNNRDEFIELQNTSAESVSIGSWELRNAIEFSFPTNAILGAGESVLVVSFDPGANTTALNAFKNTYGLTNNTRIFGPFAGELNNATDAIELWKLDTGSQSFVLVEAVQYIDETPWPTGADGIGSSLQRLSIAFYGNDPTNWFAAGVSPGSQNVPNTSPLVQIVSPRNGNFPSQQPLSVIVSAADLDGQVSRVELLANGEKVGEITISPFEFSWIPDSFGSYLLTARAFDNRAAVTISDAVEIFIVAAPPSTSITSPTNGARLVSGSPITISAAASDADGFVDRVEFFAGQIKIGEVTRAPYNFSWVTPLIGNHALTTRVFDNMGNSGNSLPVNISVLAGFATNSSLISTGSVWKYFDQGMEPAGWRNLGYNDTAWSQGRAQLGYGDGDEVTVVGFGPNSSSKYPTTYFRRAFTVTGSSAVQSLSGAILRDDGAVVYLNGTEVFRTGMPEGAISFSTLANITVVDADETTNFFPFNIDPSRLLEGTNVLAVEIHQVQANSSDISFDLSLQGTQVFFAPRLEFDSRGILSWPIDSQQVVLQYSDSLSPANWRTENSARTESNGMYRVTLPLTNSSRFYRLANP